MGAGNAELVSVSLGLGPACLVAAWVAEDLFRIRDEALRRGLEVHIPAGPIQSSSEGVRGVFCAGVADLKVQGEPDARLPCCGFPIWYLLIFRTARFVRSSLAPTRRLSAIRVPSSTGVFPTSAGGRPRHVGHAARDGISPAGRDEILQIPQDRLPAAQVELHPAADREYDLALLVAQPGTGNHREPAPGAAQD